jgi:phosphatidylserine decarboxylase
MSAAAHAFVLLQHVLPKRLLTQLVHWLARRRSVGLKNALIRGFCRLYPIDLEEAEGGSAADYADFNAFFTRALKPGRRPLAADPLRLVSPCDGTVSERGTIDADRVLQARLAAKSHTYTLAALLGDESAAAPFVGGEFATIYLAPYNYHRVHMPASGRLTGIRHVPGALYSVNAATAAALPGLFARNERVVCSFETALGPLAVIFVGAMNVGSVSLVGLGEITPRAGRAVSELALPARCEFGRGAELGRFNMGSTVILLLPRASVRWDDEFVARARVRVGASIGRTERPA